MVSAWNVKNDVNGWPNCDNLRYKHQILRSLIQSLESMIQISEWSKNCYNHCLVYWSNIYRKLYPVYYKLSIIYGKLRLVYDKICKLLVSYIWFTVKHIQSSMVKFLRRCPSLIQWVHLDLFWLLVFYFSSSCKCAKSQPQRCHHVCLSIMLIVKHWLD